VWVDVVAAALVDDVADVCGGGQCCGCCGGVGFVCW